ncbi:LysR family transcriptional regulator [Profundibacterium mesophilum]|uniref:D-xylulose reductase n=1 Tax=Profundibacterium mesophilum KAUST100406-0324 TaxID=1037889 RepID=A0A921NTU2_9RHOB|nr:LysR family transcriptional regulator [Profundibacterium mesophilum]KAF0676504.1 D-xylulose reductase [Profundibacterium mesophilum KAUST100406-0324]
MNFASFDLNLLRVLDALLREGSTVRASERIGLSQPAVSAALGRLRHALGDPLFVRKGQGLEPTDFARDLAIPLRKELDNLEAMLCGPSQFEPRSAELTFKITGNDFFAEMLMPRLANELSCRAPGMRIQLVDVVPGRYVEPLEQYRVDLGLIPEVAYPDWVESQPVFRSNFLVIAASGHRALAAAGLSAGDTVPLDLFCALGHVLFSPAGNIGAMGDAALAAVGRERRVVMTLPVFSGVCSAVAQSDRIALVPSQLARHMERRAPVVCYKPPMPMPRVQLSMFWHKRSTTNPSHIWLRGVIADLLAPLDEA